ncbi:hypothetical protein C2S51_026549 [Perilla frutescens var. frutescens]|nr:hypothetical protein C2S51_026549 [Perilla frutescens var. frutescens]
MFPWLAHGHIFPYLELAKNLSKLNFTIFFCSTAVNLKSINESLQATSDHRIPINLLELHLPSPPDLPPELHTTKHAPPRLMPQLHRAFGASKSSFSAIITSLNPDMLIYDAFQPWAASIAASLGIPAVHFATTGAASYSFYYHLFTKKDSAFPHGAMYLRRHELQKLRDLDVSHLKDEYDENENDGFAHFSRSTDVVLMRTSRGIEGKYMDYLSLLSIKNIISTGPLITPTTTTSDDDDSDIIDWLSKKEKFSTVFISLGSENYLSTNQLQEMAKGLEASNANFIWAIRFPQGERVDIEETLPEGFLERVRERSKIVEGWAPQTKILSNPSIFAFVSHCGMSSTIESVYFGVPIVGIPVKMDQPLNARLAVEAGVGVEVVRDENGDFVGGEVAAAIERVREKGEEMRFRAAEMSEMMKKEEEYAVSEAAEQLRRICMDCKQLK